MLDSSQGQFFFRGAVSLLLGLSVGLERERSAAEDHHTNFAGIRTFPICALTGFLCGLYPESAMLVAGFLAVAALVTAAYFKGTRAEHPGITTEAAYLLTFLLGAGCARGMVLECASTALVVTTLLAGRDKLRSFAQHMPERDLAAALKFGVISVVILPLVPNRALGDGHWYAVNFHTTWLMVVLITGIGFAGYILTRIVGPRAGTGLAGLVGGLVSSTAVALTFSRRSRESPSLSAACALAILSASAVLWVRIAMESAFVNPSFALVLAPALGGLFGVSALTVAFAWRHAASQPHTGETKIVEYRNPVALRPAILFAAAFAVVTIVVRVALRWGDKGAYFAAFLSGLHDMDAVTVSMANLTKSGSIGEKQGAAAVLIAGGANSLVKLSIALALASPSTRRIVAIGLGTTVAAAAGAMVLVLVL